MKKIVWCAGLLSRAVGLGGNDNYNNINNLNANNQLNNNGVARGIAPLQGFYLMKTYNHLYKKLYSWENLEEAYWKARRHKTNNPRVRAFDEHWRLYLCQLLNEMRTKTYTPRPLQRFVLRDPKTRVICVSDFRDRIVHHALVNILQPIFEPRFIHDSYASREGKGNLLALVRFDVFLHKVSKNGRLIESARNKNQIVGFAFKADIKHYFDTVDHEVLLNMIKRRIKDENILWLIHKILANHNAGIPGKGMPLGNWTSQFFANIYLNELDQFVKHELKAKYYIRYVDDFVIVHEQKVKLQEYKQKISQFLKILKLELHPTKCKISSLGRGITLLGFRVFYHHKLVRKRNIRKIKVKCHHLLEKYGDKGIDHQEVLDVFQGWDAYARHGNSYRLCQRLREEIARKLEIRR